MNRASPVSDRDTNPGENIHMKNLINKLTIAIMNLQSEEGQDLVEYALLVALIAFACTAGVGALATSINSAFSSLAAGMSQV